MIRLALPYPPSVNHYWHAKGNRRFISKAGREFATNVSVVVEQYRLETKHKRGYLANGRLSFHYELYLPDRRKRDIDNVLKSTFDSLVKANVFEDDEQIFKLSGTKHLKGSHQFEKGAIVVEIKELSNDEIVS